MNIKQLFLVTTEPRLDFIENGVRTISLARFLAGMV